MVLRQNPEFSEMKLLPAFLTLSGVFAQYDDSSSSDPESASDYSGSSSPDDIDDGYGGRLGLIFLLEKTISLQEKLQEKNCELLLQSQFFP